MDQRQFDIDAKTWLIKVSRNVAFNENEEPKKLEIVEVLDVQAKGRLGKIHLSNSLFLKKH